MSATPRQKNIAAQCPPVAKISASSASAAPVAVNTWIAKARTLASFAMILCWRMVLSKNRFPLFGTMRYWFPQSSLTISAERPARFQLRPKPRKRDLSERETMTSGPTQYWLLRITTFSPFLLPGTGVMAPPP